MAKNLEKTYKPHDFENRIYSMWEENGAFRAEKDDEKKSFTIVMPPPNITGQLHMGHALDQTLQDVLIRYKRMCGYSALWIPGSDHASIATEVKVAESIKREEGLSKEELGREEFLKRAWEWKRVYGGKITQQCRKLGDSCDWSRERFTMDEGCNKAVVEYFVRLYEKGYIYRGSRLINWCPDCGTSLSDAEVEHEDREGMYWYFRYPSVDGREDVVVATSRPETMFADVAIAVNPDDDRYTKTVGNEVYIPLTERSIPVIEDEYPDPEKGSGAVKITPAHDMNDFEVGSRHGLDMPACIDEDGNMTELAGKYSGMDRYECRKRWVAELEEAGYLVKTEKLQIPTGECYRCHTVVEPMLSEQWFLKMEELAKPALEAAKTGALRHVPERFEKIYMHWLEEIKDWCISRQLWWGHRIPAYYCDECGHVAVSATPVERCAICNSENVRQDEDVLDTWFSSALWPVSTLGWPEKTDDFDYFYPTDVLVTGYDIIFFWVVRMVFSALELTDELPFKDVYIHGLVRDKDGRKMSKSLGNGIDPLEVIEEVGADALRFMLTSGITAGNDMRYRQEKLIAARNFANKLWNASRFVIMNLQDEEGEFMEIGNISELRSDELMAEDRWLLAKINEVSKAVGEHFEKYELSLAAFKVEELIWGVYCDWYIEIVKSRLQDERAKGRKTAGTVLLHGLSCMLRLLHPFMPFITEEIWSHLPDAVKEKTKDNPHGYLIKTRYPEFTEDMSYEQDSLVIDKARDIISAVREIRVEAGASAKKKLSLFVLAGKEDRKFIEASFGYVREIGNVGSIEFIDDESAVSEDVITKVIAGASLFVPSSELIDVQAELIKLEKEREKLLAEVGRVEKMLSNPGFVNKAPQSKIDEEKKKRETYSDMLNQVESRINHIKSRSQSGN